MLFRSPQWAGVRSDPSFSTVEVALLCCFGLDQHAQRSHEALRAALIDAGLPPRATRPLIRLVRPLTIAVAAFVLIQASYPSVLR